MNAPTRFAIEVYGGGYVDTSQPSGEHIRLEDIAHALSHTCRFNGHTNVFYSVAEHAWHCSRILEQYGHPQAALAALHHDDSEAYLGDIVRPLRAFLGEAYEQMTQQMDDVVCQAFGQQWDPAMFDTFPVLDADLFMLSYEASRLLPSGGRPWAPEPTWPLTSYELPCFAVEPAVAKQLFLEQHHRLTMVAPATGWMPWESFIRLPFHDHG